MMLLHSIVVNLLSNSFLLLKFELAQMIFCKRKKNQGIFRDLELHLLEEPKICTKVWRCNFYFSKNFLPWATQALKELDPSKPDSLVLVFEMAHESIHRLPDKMLSLQRLFALSQATRVYWNLENSNFRRSGANF